MPLARLSPEPDGDPGNHRLGQGDLGQEDQDLGVGIGRQCSGGGLQIDLGLPGTCDPIQQGDIEPTASHHIGQHVRGGDLTGVQHLALQARIRCPKGRFGDHLFQSQNTVCQ